jgi:endogenous inhibitor of DNA gyrase (YacG/DUF329 family)
MVACAPAQKTRRLNSPCVPDSLRADTMSETENLRIVRCPGCGGKSIYGERNAYRPFCSERCKNADLGAWASEAFRVAADPFANDDSAEPTLPE